MSTNQMSRPAGRGLAKAAPVIGVSMLLLFLLSLEASVLGGVWWVLSLSTTAAIAAAIVAIFAALTLWLDWRIARNAWRVERAMASGRFV